MMTAEQLKNSILQLAMQGKLVEQRPEEGIGEELYKKIKNEKRSIVLSGALKGRKTKPHLNIDLIEKPYDIPNTWKWIRLGDVAEVFGRIGFRGYQKKDIVDRGEGAITLSPSNIDQNGSFQYDNCTYISWEKYEESPEIKISNGDILVVKTGSSYGKCGIVTQLPEKATINPQLAVLKYILCDPLFLTYALMGPFSKAQFEGFVIGTSIPTFSQEKLGNLIVALPPLAEQKRIVAKIEELMPFVEQYAAASTKLNTLNATFPDMIKKSILQEAVQGKLVPQDPNDEPASVLLKKIAEEKKRLIKDGLIKAGKKYNSISEEEIAFDIPETWMWARLSEVVFNRGQKKPENTFSYIDIGSIDNVHHKLNDEENIIEPENAPSRARKIVAIGDVIYSTVRPYLHNMCIIDRESSHEPIASTGFAAMTCHEGLYNKYLFYFLLSPYFDRYANDTENSKGVAYPAINDQKLYKALVPLPPFNEQKRIVVKIEELMSFVDGLKD